MNCDKNKPSLPPLTADLLKSSGMMTDNLFSDMWKTLGLSTLLSRAGFKKRSGTPVDELVYVLLIWVWLKAGSVAMFARDSLLSFSNAKKDALYDLLKREDFNWRKLQLSLAKKVISATDTSTLRAFVVDDSVKIRRGKKMPGISSHFDHLTGRCVMGQQVLTLGLATASQFVPLDSEIFISKSKKQPLPNDFKDGRSITVKRYRNALAQSKPDMVTDMISRALGTDINAEYFLADAWFATKPMLKLTEDKSLIGIVRMKKNKMKYEFSDGKTSISSINAIFHKIQSMLSIFFSSLSGSLIFLSRLTSKILQFSHLSRLFSKFRRRKQRSPAVVSTNFDIESSWSLIKTGKTVGVLDFLAGLLYQELCSF